MAKRNEDTSSASAVSSINISVSWNSAVPSRLRVSDVTGSCEIEASPQDLRWIAHLSREIHSHVARLHKGELNRRLVLIAQGLAVLEARRRLHRARPSSEPIRGLFQQHAGGQPLPPPPLLQDDGLPF